MRPLIGQALEITYDNPIFLRETEFVGKLQKKDGVLIVVNERGQYVPFAQAKSYELIGKDLKEEAQQGISNLLGLLDPDKIENEDDMTAVLTGAVEAVGDGDKKVEDPEDQEFIKGLAVKLLGEWIEKSPLPRVEETIVAQAAFPHVAAEVIDRAVEYLEEDGASHEKAYTWITDHFTDRQLVDLWKKARPSSGSDEVAASKAAAELVQLVWDANAAIEADEDEADEDYGREEFEESSSRTPLTYKLRLLESLDEDDVDRIGNSVASMAALLLHVDFGVESADKALDWIHKHYTNEKLFDLFFSKNGKTEEDFIRLTALDVAEKSQRYLNRTISPRVPKGPIGDWEVRSTDPKVEPVVYKNVAANQAKANYVQDTGVEYVSTRVRRVRENDAASDVKNEDWDTGSEDKLTEAADKKKV